MLKLPNIIFQIIKKLPPKIRYPISISCCVLLIAYSLLTGCANPIPPEGGPRDKTPPHLDSLRSTPNFQTHFKKQTIVLAFDEWVELKDVFNQVVISPPLERRPDIVRKKKTIQVSFGENEVFRDSATYVINFGESIRDLTEGNVAPVVFVFSTGDYIDSLSVEGKIVDAWTGKPSENVLFMLYENLADTVVRKERPFYFARTDKEGRFKVNNVKSGTFKAFALSDQNLNYRFDSDAELIGYPDSLILLKGLEKTKTDSLVLDTLWQDTLRQDSTILLADSLRQPTTPAPNLEIRIFFEEKQLFLRAKEVNRYGLAKLTFNREPYDARLTFDSLGQTVVFENIKDTIQLWYNLEADTAWNIYFQRDTLIDTILVKSGLRANFMNTARLVAKSKPGPPVRLAPGKPFAVSFSHPLTGFDLANIRLLEDTTRVVVQPRIRLDSMSRRDLMVDFNWKEGLSYELRLLPGSVTDMFGLSNTDSTSWKFIAGLEKDYGTLTLSVKNLKPDTAYVIRVLDKDIPLQTFKAMGVDSFHTSLPRLMPTTYTIEVIEDLDRNGRWTTGHYDLHRQPERVYRKTLEQLRANWELEAEVDAGLIGTYNFSNPAPATGNPARGPSGTGPPTIRPGERGN
jgi:hypothetical protein